MALRRLATPLTEKMEPGLVVPMPTLPVSMILKASVRRPDLKVEKIRSPFPVSEFWVRSEVTAPVVVAPPPRSSVRKEILTAVVVAEAKLASTSGVEVAAERVEVAVTVPKTGEVVAERVKVYVEPELETERSA